MHILIGLTIACLHMNFADMQCESRDIRVDGYESYYFPHSDSHRTDIYEEGKGYYISSTIDRCDTSEHFSSN